MSHFIMYLIFIALILSSSIRFQIEIAEKALKFSDFLTPQMYSNYSTYYQRNQPAFKQDQFKNFYLRVEYPNAMDISITIFIIGQLQAGLIFFLFNLTRTINKIGFIWHEVKLILQEGVKDYLQSWKNILNTTTNILYFASYSLKYYTLIIVYLKKKEAYNSNLWSDLASLNNITYSQETAIYKMLYWLNAGMPQFYSQPLTNVYFFNSLSTIGSPARQTLKSCNFLISNSIFHLK